MNCQEFENLIVKLACEVPMDTAARAQALAHTDACRACRLRFVRQQNIASALQVLADDEQAIQAPEHIGRLLLATFAQQQEPAIVKTITPRKNFAAALRWKWATAMVATALLLFALSQWWHTPQPVPLASLPARQGTNAAPQSAASTGQTIQPEVTAQATVAARVISKHPLRRKLHSERQAEEENGAFLSLRPNMPAEPTEFEQIVRLQIPRTTLALWGVKLNDERDGEQVQAEVVFGEDGVARAIRILN
ncbi:MAG: hypothetical protein U0Y68_15100 [Blastocatellia bacterium]